MISNFVISMNYFSKDKMQLFQLGRFCKVDCKVPKAPFKPLILETNATEFYIYLFEDLNMEDLIPIF